MGEFPSAISTGRFSERGVLRSEWHLSIKSHRVCAGNGETGLRCAMKSNGPACPGESSSRGAAMSSFARVLPYLLVKATPSAIRCYAPANLPCEGFCKRRPRPAVSPFVLHYKLVITSKSIVLNQSKSSSWQSRRHTWYI